jgi:hypothetical protein
MSTIYVNEGDILTNSILVENQPTAWQNFQRLKTFCNLVLLFIVQMTFELHQWLWKEGEKKCSPEVYSHMNWQRVHSS